MKKIHLIIAAAVVILDQLTKYAAANLLGKPLQVLPFLTFSYITNTGAGFSILQGQNLLLAGVAVVIIGVLLNFFKKFDRIEQYFVAAVIGGALGNLIDRLVFGHVIDFIMVPYWPVFNIADSAISVSAVILVILSFRKH